MVDKWYPLQLSDFVRSCLNFKSPDVLPCFVRRQEIWVKKRKGSASFLLLWDTSARASRVGAWKGSIKFLCTLKLQVQRAESSSPSCHFVVGCWFTEMRIPFTCCFMRQSRIVALCDILRSGCYDIPFRILLFECCGQHIPIDIQWWTLLEACVKL